MEQQPNQAVAILEQGYAANPDAPALLAALVQGYLDTDKIELAARLCRDKVAAEPDNAFAHNLLAQVYLRDNRPEQAEAALTAAIERNPGWNVPHNNLARLYLSQGRTDQAVANLEKAIAQNPGDTTAQMTLAALYHQLDQVEMAMALYEKALAADPYHWAAANNLAYLLAEHRSSAADLDRALDLARQANRQRPEDPMVLDTLGWVHYQRGDLPAAITLLMEAVEKVPENGTLQYHLAQALYAADRLDEAREALKKAVSDDSGLDERSEAQELLRKLGG